MNQQKKKIGIALAALAVLAVIFAAVYFFNRPQGTAGEKPHHQNLGGIPSGRAGTGKADLR